MTELEATTYLNTTCKCYLAPSKIHGVGVFALRDLKEGEKLYADEFPRSYKITEEGSKNILPEIKKMILEQWPRIVIDATFAWPATRWIAYMNHNDNPSYFGGRDIMLRDVKKDEEITEDYRHIEGWEKVYPWLVDKS